MESTKQDAAAHPFLYPRMRIRRTLTRLAGRLVLPAFFYLSIQGQENFPKSGPLIVVGNHVAIMEVAMMFVYTPWLVEFFGSNDVPHDAITAFFAKLVGFIPVMRGSLDRPSLRAALGILEQGGILGVFPEGGIWQAGSEKTARPGVAWLSARAKAPVLPVYFSGTYGALEQALRFKRPPLGMTVGSLLPAAVLPKNETRKTYLHTYADGVLAAIDVLRPPGEKVAGPGIREERFELEVTLLDANDSPLPAAEIRHPASLAHLLHMPTVMKIFQVNLRLPVQALRTLSQRPPAAEIARGCTAILAYLEADNPYLLTYRFGPRQAEAMRLALQDLQALAERADRTGARLHVTPVRRFIAIQTGQEITQVEQGFMERWM